MAQLACKLYLYIDNEETLEECLKSIYVDNEEAMANLEINILDAVCSDKTKGLSEEYGKFHEKYKENTHYTACEGVKAEEAYQNAMQSDANAENEAFNETAGQKSFVAFIKSTTVYSKHSLNAIFKKAEEFHDVPIAFSPVYYNKKGTRRDYLKFEKPRNLFIDTNKQYTWYNPYLASYLIPFKLLKEAELNTELKYEGLVDYLIRLVDKAGGYYLMGETVLTREDLEVDPYNYPPLFEREWYKEHVEEYILSVLKQKPSKFVQFAMLYSLGAKFAGNLNDRNKTLFNKEEVEEFFDASIQAVRLIDDDVLLYNADMEMKRVLPRHVYYRFYLLKYDRKLPKITYREDKDGQFVMSGDTLVECIPNMDARLFAMNNTKENLEIWGVLKNAYFMDYDKVKVYTKVGNKTVEAVPNEIYSLIKLFGVSVHKDYSFSISIPKTDLRHGQKIAVFVEYEGTTLQMPIGFEKPQAHFWSEFPNAYWRVDNYYLTYRTKKKAFVVEKANPFRGICKELAFWHSALKYGEEFKRSVQVLPLRLLYFMTRPYYKKKNIWITYDQLFKGGDNGEYFYRYVSERKDKGNIIIYYVANKNTKEYKELNAKYGTVLAFNSLKHKLVSLHANYVFATRVAFNVYLGYWKQTERYFRDMFNAEVFCLQHGLTIQKIAQYQNRLFDNTKLYFCVSPVEMDNIRNKVYGYKEEELILTGAPRYDGLVSKDKRYILLSPTWRRNVTAGTNKKGSNHDYSPNFKHTEYFRIYNSLINDKKLIEHAKKYNYKLIYLIHPILSPQIKDFDTNDYVKIIPGAGNVSYEKMLSEASLMLTDHSGIQFDFAYMRKPLVYYHPDSLPPQYEEGGLKYETMGFGPVCKNHEEVVDALCDYMQKDCVIHEEYKQRVENFFTFDDHKNCERIYEATLAYMNKR